MEYKNIFVVIFLISVQINFCKSDTQTLKQLHVVFRHGHRTPDDVWDYPNDPYINETWSPYGRGQLTTLGKRQEFEIGTIIRKYYGSFLGNIYTPDILDARSTDLVRTKMSLLCVLAGLWPPTKEQQFIDYLLWQPIPYDYTPSSNDTLLGFPLLNCNKYRKEYSLVLHSPEVQNFLKDNNETIDYIYKNSGVNITKFLDIFVLYIKLYTEKGMGRPLPEWTNQVYSNFLANNAPREYIIQTYNKELQKYAGGFFIRKLLKDIEAVSQDNSTTNSKKLFLYSAHEYNIAHLLIALKIFDLHIPSYSASMFFEYHHIENVDYIKVYHYELNMLKRKLVRIPGCNYLCPLTQFKKFVKDIIPEENTTCS